jgi:hypothetical protein
MRIAIMDFHAILDPRGELQIDMGDDWVDIKRLLVCPYAMARASKVWDDILFGSSAEAQPKPCDGNPWVVSLPYDSISAMIILLRIVHGHFRYVPHELSLDDLFEIAILTDKYKLTDILSPWVNGWLAPSRSNMLATMDTLPCDPNIMEWTKKKLWIAWEFGDRTLFELTCKKIMKDWVTDEHGSLSARTHVPRGFFGAVPSFLTPRHHSNRYMLQRQSNQDVWMSSRSC